MADKVLYRDGFGQVEPNHLSMQRTGQIYAQLPADPALGNVLENGRFVKYDYAKGKVNLTGDGEWMMIFNEVKLYGDTYNETYKDYAMQKKNFTDGVMTPRVVKTNIGDIYTTNCVGAANTYRAHYEGIDVTVGAELAVDPDSGYLVAKASGDENGPIFQVVKIYTMADGQPAVKLMRIK